jgi:hypothetical protein
MGIIHQLFSCRHRMGFPSHSESKGVNRGVARNSVHERRLTGRSQNTPPHLIRLNRQQSQYTEVVHFTSEGVHAPSLSILTQRPHLYHSWLPSLDMICSRDVLSIHEDHSLARGRAPKYPIAAWRVNSQIPVLIQAMLVLDPCELPARRDPPVRNVEEGMLRGIFRTRTVIGLDGQHRHLRWQLR